MPPKKLFVASLQSNTKKKKQDLLALFSQFGEIKRVELVSQKKHSKRCKGFAFVTFERAEDALQVLNTQVFMKGRKLTIREQLKGKRLHDYKTRFKRRRMFVGDLPAGLTDYELRATFEGLGEVETAYLIRDHHTGESESFGYVLFKSEADVERVLSREVYLKGVLVRCEGFRERGEHAGRRGSERSGGYLEQGKQVDGHEVPFKTSDRRRGWRRQVTKPDSEDEDWYDQRGHYGDWRKERDQMGAPEWRYGQEEALSGMKYPEGNEGRNSYNSPGSRQLGQRRPQNGSKVRPFHHNSNFGDGLPPRLDYHHNGLEQPTEGYDSYKRTQNESLMGYAGSSHPKNTEKEQKFLDEFWDFSDHWEPQTDRDWYPSQREYHSNRLKDAQKSPEYGSHEYIDIEQNNTNKAFSPAQEAYNELLNGPDTRKGSKRLRISHGQFDEAKVGFGGPEGKRGSFSARKGIRGANDSQHPYHIHQISVSGLRVDYDPEHRSRLERADRRSSGDQIYDDEHIRNSPGRLDYSRESFSHNIYNRGQSPESFSFRGRELKDCLRGSNSGSFGHQDRQQGNQNRPKRKKSTKIVQSQVSPNLDNKPVHNIQNAFNNMPRISHDLPQLPNTQNGHQDHLRSHQQPDFLNSPQSPQRPPEENHRVSERLIRQSEQRRTSFLTATHGSGRYRPYISFERDSGLKSNLIAKKTLEGVLDHSLGNINLINRPKEEENDEFHQKSCNPLLSALAKPCSPSF